MTTSSLVDDHDLALAPVEAMRDDAGSLRPLGDAAQDVALLSRELLEPVGVAWRAQRHDHRHLSSSFGRGRVSSPAPRNRFTRRRIVGP
jgi:hypothetical protein